MRPSTGSWSTDGRCGLKRVMIVGSVIYGRVRVAAGARSARKNFWQSKHIQKRGNMDDSELFDVFNVDNNPEPAQKTIQAPPREKPKKQKKSKHENVAAKETTANGGGAGVSGKRPHDHVSTETSQEQQMDGVENTGVAKKVRKLADNPIIVDSFETETDQIVPATTGLQGVAPKDQNIVIKKRVITYSMLCLLSVVSTCSSVSNGRLEIYSP